METVLPFTRDFDLSQHMKHFCDLKTHPERKVPVVRWSAKEFLILLLKAEIY